MTTMAEAARKPPLIVVVGATGTGKSKLAIELAGRFNGEIINADAMQMYKGLPIVTNKVPEFERNGIKHYLLDEIGLTEKPWTVHEFVKEGTRIVEEIRQKGKLPIVVGGTSYYVQSLLFKNATIEIETDTGSGRSDSEDASAQGSKQPRHPDLAILDASTEQLYAKLHDVDPAMAKTWHPKDRRRIQRSLEIWLKSGRKPSEVYAKQEMANDELTPRNDDDVLRYNPVVFWLDAEDDVLKARLNSRVETMVHQGLLKEVSAMRDIERQCHAKGDLLDYTKGIWVAIGYNQLALWLNAVGGSGKEGSRTEPEQIAELQKEGIESVKAATRQYAKRQKRWIRIRLANAIRKVDMLNNLFLLDCTDLHAWDKTITEPSKHIVQAFLDGEKLPANTSLSTLAAVMLSGIQQHKEMERTRHFCEICRKIMMDEKQWTRHLQSQSHKKVLDGLRKRKQRDEYLAKLERPG